VKWLPQDGNIKAILHIVHGMAEHIMRYDAFASYLAECGFMVVGHDHIGHGNSVESTSDWGYFPPRNGHTILVEDLQRHRIRTQIDYPDIPYFMLGHSMGSYLLRKYLVDYGDGLAGAIVMGTGFVPGAAVRGGIALCQAMAKVKGWRHRSLLVTGLTFGRDYKAYDMTGKNPGNSWLTRDAEVVKRNLTDPACRYLFTLAGYIGLFRTVLFDSKQKNTDAIPADLPILIVSGDKDPVGANGKGVRKVEAMFRKVARPDLTCRLYEGDRHEILNELDRERVYEDLRAWMEARI
jgi:alpha-beta hydrolase superfamily lysophospholipase